VNQTNDTPFMNKTTKFFIEIFGSLLDSYALKFHVAKKELYTLPGEPELNNTCMYVFPRKKTGCDKKALENGYCHTHRATGNIVETASRGGCKVLKPKKITATEQKFLNMRATAIPQHVTTLSRIRKGLLLDPITDILFDEEYKVLGSKGGGNKILKLSPADVSICELNGWQYTDEVVDE